MRPNSLHVGLILLLFQHTVLMNCAQTQIALRSTIFKFTRTVVAMLRCNALVSYKIWCMRSANSALLACAFLWSV